MANFSGNIPQQITIIAKPAQDVKWRFDDISDQPEDQQMTWNVRPAFVSDATNAKTLETGRNWAGDGRVYNYATREYVKVGDVTEVTVNNLPFKGLRVINLEHRAEGGRAWKVVTDDGYYFDMREDILLESLRMCGTSPGGILEGEYLWAKVGSQMKIIRAGSELHKRLMQATTRGTYSKIAMGKLVPGGVYETKAGKRFIFCGYFHNVVYSRQGEYKQYLRETIYTAHKRVENNKLAMFFEITDYYWKAKKPEEWRDLLMEQISESDSDWIHGFEFKSSSSFVMQVGTVDLPDNLAELLRNQAQRIATRKSLQKATYEDNWVYWYYGSRFLNIYPIDEPIVENAYMAAIWAKHTEGKEIPDDLARLLP
ncbi:MAG: hypothetical protein WCY09_10030 [Candidatus Omnitrophota bacterium]